MAKEYTLDRVTHSIRLRPEDRHRILEHLEFLILDSENPPQDDRDFWYNNVLELALQRAETRKEVSEKIQKAKTEQLETDKEYFSREIEQLKAENSELKQEIGKGNTQFQDAINAVTIAENENNRLKEVINQTVNQMNQLQSNAIVPLTESELKFIRYYLTNAKTRKAFDNFNRNEKLFAQSVLKQMNTDSEPQNIAALLYNVFILNAANYSLAPSFTLEGIKKIIS